MVYFTMFSLVFVQVKLEKFNEIGLRSIDDGSKAIELFCIFQTLLFLYRVLG